jgi:hypothetical protein
MMNILWMGSMGMRPLKQYFYTQSLNILSVNGKKVFFMVWIKNPVYCHIHGFQPPSKWFLAGFSDGNLHVNTVFVNRNN